MLYMPASNARLLEKAKTLPVDGIVFDLEDSVMPEAKELARAKACEAVRSHAYGHRELVVRINDLSSQWADDDLKAVALSGADAVLVPKIDRPENIVEITAILEKHGAPQSLAVWAMMETPLGILNAQAIAALAEKPDSRLVACVMGTNDLAKDIGCTIAPFAPPLIDAAVLCLLAAKAYGLVLLDGVYNEISDSDGFKDACVQAAGMGFDGKTLLHPSQIDICNDIFAPSAEQVRHARAIISAFDLHENHDKGVIMLEGQMVERLHLDMAKKTVAYAQQIEQQQQG